MGRSDFGSVKLVRDGGYVASANSSGDDGIFTAGFEAELKVDAPSWIALLVPPSPEGEGPLNLFGRTIFAHTSAVTVRVRGRSPGNSEIVEDLLYEVRRDRAAVLEKAQFGSDAEREAVTAVYDEAIRTLESRLR